MLPLHLESAAAAQCRQHESQPISCGAFPFFDRYVHFQQVSNDSREPRRESRSCRKSCMTARLFVAASGLQLWTVFLPRPLKSESSPRVLSKWEVIDHERMHIGWDSRLLQF
jgi:hypothetical protein